MAIRGNKEYIRVLSHCYYYAVLQSGGGGPPCTRLRAFSMGRGLCMSILHADEHGNRKEHYKESLGFKV